MKIIVLALVIALASCVSRPFSEREEILAKTQCPIGYHLKQSGGIEVYTSKQEKKQSIIEFNCVIDSAHDTLNNTNIYQ